MALGLLATVAAAADFQFEGIQPALTPASKHQIITSPSVTIDGVTSQTPYNVLYRSGDTVGDLVIGQMLDMEGNPVKALDWTTGEPKDGVRVWVAGGRAGSGTTGLTPAISAMPAASRWGSARRGTRAPSRKRPATQLSM